MSEGSDAVTRSLMDAHVAVCAERYGSLWTAIGDLKTSIHELKDMMRTTEATMHTRYNAISNRMWLALACVTGSAVGGLGVVVFYLLTRGKS